GLYGCRIDWKVDRGMSGRVDRFSCLKSTENARGQTGAEIWDEKACGKTISSLTPMNWFVKVEVKNRLLESVEFHYRHFYNGREKEVCFGLH
ncbi:MAG: hypothetical protein WC057_09895, partial [Dehalococcoidales bacterium]